MGKNKTILAIVLMAGIVVAGIAYLHFNSRESTDDKVSAQLEAELHHPIVGCYYNTTTWQFASLTDKNTGCIFPDDARAELRIIATHDGGSNWIELKPSEYSKDCYGGFCRITFNISNDTTVRSGGGLMTMTEK